MNHDEQSKQLEYEYLQKIRTNSNKMFSLQMEYRIKLKKIHGLNNEPENYDDVKSSYTFVDLIFDTKWKRARRVERMTNLPSIHELIRLEEKLDEDGSRLTLTFPILGIFFTFIGAALLSGEIVTMPGFEVHAKLMGSIAITSAVLTQIAAIASGNYKLRRQFKRIKRIERRLDDHLKHDE